ncbi:hypothetical protein D1007_13821 [Hordeum vulgare]|nr:hypothetical protein D1007_13821 [Hordeum vulgare]
MDMRALGLKAAAGPSFLAPRPRRHPPATWAPRPAGEIGLGPRSGRRWPGLAVSASGKKSRHGRDGDDPKSRPSSSGKGDASTPIGDDADAVSQSHGELKSSDTMYVPSNLSYWRDVRASFVIPKSEQAVDVNTLPQTSFDGPVHCLPRKWAHSISAPESGCVLVATEELDGNGTFERTVILLLKLGSRDAYDGPFGVILNRPLYTKMKHVNPSFRDQAMPFGDCSLFFGGPVDMSIFLMRTNEGRPIKGFEEVAPGVCFGFRTDLQKVGHLMKNGALNPEDLKFYVGYSAWDHDQLLSEIDAGYWVVTSCSSGLITDALMTDPSCLWSEVLQMMGGQYAELSQKPKEDSA